MKISVVIPAYNEEKLLPETLRSVFQSARAFEEMRVEWECIVCNNNSTDGTAEVAKTAGAKVVFEPVNQIGRARNTGAAAATGDWLIFCDADSHPSIGLFRDVVNEIRTGRTLAGGSTICIQENSEEVKEARKGFGWAVRLWNRVSQHMEWFAGSFIFCSKAAFDEVGGFDLQYYASEEIDLAKRLKRVERRQGKRVHILNTHPLVTSARKASLYSPREHLGFLFKTIVLGGRPLRKREACFTWYDGRR